MLKKITAVLTVFSLCVAMLGGCNDNTATDSGKLNIVTTSFSPYDFAKQITGDKAEVTMLLPPGSESHSYEPTPQDAIKIQKCDVFVYVGGDSDSWVTDILSSLDTKKVEIITLMDCVDLKEEELKEGMTAEHENGGDDEKEYDEHVWTSPVNAKRIVNKMLSAICEADTKDKDAFTTNAENYKAKLDELDISFKNVVENAKRKTMIFADRFPIRYFTDEYGLDYFAAFPGCSSDTEPSASTVAFIIDKVKSLGIPVVFTIELSNGKMADTICESTGAKKIQWNSCHNVTADQFKQGTTYLKLMQQNVDSLKEALN